MIKKIDIHIHIGKLVKGKSHVNLNWLLKRMTSLNIERACLMTVVKNYETDFYYDNYYTLDICKKYSNRLIPFMNFPLTNLKDLRNRIIKFYSLGFKGFGEIITIIKFI